MFGKRNLRKRQQQQEWAELVTAHLLDTLKAVTFELENGMQMPPELGARIQGLDDVVNGEGLQPINPQLPQPIQT